MQVEEAQQSSIVGPPRVAGESVSVGHAVSAVEPDWSREELTRFWDPGRQLLRCLRGFQRSQQHSGSIAKLGRKWNSLKHRFWSAVSGADIPLETSIGGGLLLPHPNGIVIHPDAHIGVNCLIFQQVTLGTTARGGLPRVGGHVDIGAGAKVLGAVTLGDHSRVGANSVVLIDVPEGATAIGAPAKIRGVYEPDCIPLQD